jgi:hypothetical protein
VTVFTGTIPTISAGDTTTVPTNLATYRDALKGASEAWTSYTPTWTAASVNPVLNNGSFTGSAYARINKLVIFRIVLTMGSTTTYGTGAWRLTLPVTPLTAAGRVTFPMSIADFGTGFYRGEAIINLAPYFELFCDPTTAGNTMRSVGTGIPHSWAVSDTLIISGAYESA